MEEPCDLTSINRGTSSQQSKCKLWTRVAISMLKAAWTSVQGHLGSEYCIPYSGQTPAIRRAGVPPDIPSFNTAPSLVLSNPSFPVIKGTGPVPAILFRVFRVHRL